MANLFSIWILIYKDLTKKKIIKRKENFVWSVQVHEFMGILEGVSLFTPGKRNYWVCAVEKFLDNSLHSVLKYNVISKKKFQSKNWSRNSPLSIKIMYLHTNNMWNT